MVCLAGVGVMNLKEGDRIVYCRPDGTVKPTWPNEHRVEWVRVMQNGEPLVHIQEIRHPWNEFEEPYKIALVQDEN